MKNNLLLGAVLLTSYFTVSGQQLQSQNFDGLTIGNVGTTLTANGVPGQGGMVTLVTANGQNSDFQIINENSTIKNVLQITGDSGPAGTTPATNNTRLLGFDSLDWSTRTAGNNFLNVSFDFFAAQVAGSKSTQRFVIMDDAGVVLGGFQYNTETGALDGIMSGDNDKLNLISFGASATVPLIAAPNTWYKIGISINSTTGTATWLIPALNVYSNFVSTNIVNKAPSLASIFVFPTTGNAAAPVFKYDNFSFVAAASAGSLSSREIIVSNEFSVFPNPANDIITIANESDVYINSIQITDLNGRVVKNEKLGGVTNARINITDISSGIYLMTVTSDKGSLTKKIVKN